MAELSRLQSVDQEVLDQVNGLLRALSERIPPCTLPLLQSVVENPVTELWVVTEDGRIIGMGELAITLKPEGVIAQIEDVVVLESQRGKGLGTMLLQKLVEQARARDARVIQLSSRSDRVAANKLYQKLGFKLHNTNVYHMEL